jgi:hypothetical protein
MMGSPINPVPVALPAFRAVVPRLRPRSRAERKEAAQESQEASHRFGLV